MITTVACTPLGDITPPEFEQTFCHCGQPIHPTPSGNADWAWADDQGNTRIDNTTSVLTEEHRIREDITTSTAGTPAWNRYSVLSAQLGLGWIDLGHAHTPTSGGAALTPPPWCHGQPMHAIPTGWQCRPTRAIHPYQP